jgi:hypothetical protein
VAVLRSPQHQLHGRLRERTAGIVGDDLDGTIERALAGKPEHKVDVVLLAEIHHFRAAVVTIAAQGDSGSRPVRRKLLGDREPPFGLRENHHPTASEVIRPPSNAAVIFLLATAGKANGRNLSLVMRVWFGTIE